MNMSKIKKEITLGGVSYLVVDLTEPLKKDTEVFPGDPKPVLNKVFSRIQDTGFQYHIQTLGDHNFHAHVDAPSHQNPEFQERGLEYWGIDDVFNPAFMIDLSGAPESRALEGISWLTEVKKKHLEKHAKEFAEKNAVIIRTGYDKWLESNKPHNVSAIPYFIECAADFISSFKNIKTFGTDSLTVDPAGVHYTHKKFKEIMIVESLVHLYEIPEAVRSNFDLQTSPIRITGATGGPVSVYAFIKK